MNHRQPEHLNALDQRILHAIKVHAFKQLIGATADAQNKVLLVEGADAVVDPGAVVIHAADAAAADGAVM